uniref:Secreted protein n=1 Tax=Heterorhabditis bacteriophora TaxID=37862 RepID=A0A1I7WLM8_HETBA
MLCCRNQTVILLFLHSDYAQCDISFLIGPFSSLDDKVTMCNSLPWDSLSNFLVLLERSRCLSSFA